MITKKVVKSIKKGYSNLQKNWKLHDKPCSHNKKYKTKKKQNKTISPMPLLFKPTVKLAKKMKRKMT